MDLIHFDCKPVLQIMDEGTHLNSLQFITKKPTQKIWNIFYNVGATCTTVYQMASLLIMAHNLATVSIFRHNRTALLLNTQIWKQTHHLGFVKSSISQFKHSVRNEG